MSEKKKDFRPWLADTARDCGVGGKESYQLGERILAEWKVLRRGSDRSLEQNAFYFGVIIPAFVDSFGDTDREFLHHQLKETFLTVHNEKGKTYIRSTTSLTVAEMSKYMENCINYLIDFGGTLPNESISEYKSLTKSKK